MRVACCQLREVVDDVPRALNVVQQYARRADQQNADVVLFPECYLQGYVVDPEFVARTGISLDSDAFNDVLQSLSSITATIVLGLIERSGSRYYNTAVAVQSGKLLAAYRKSHLLRGEKGVFHAGDEFPTFKIKEHLAGINICYDLNFNEATTPFTSQSAEILLCPCNNMMPTQTAEHYKQLHNEIRAERAREHRIWLASSDVTGTRPGRIGYGPTAVIDPQGRVVEQVPLGSPGMITVDMPPSAL